MRSLFLFISLLLPTWVSASCLSETPPELRQFMTDIYLSLRSKGQKPDELNRKMSKMMGMIIEESSANTCSMSDMNGTGSSSSYNLFFKKNKSKGIMSRSHKVDLDMCKTLLSNSSVLINKQTNYGLAQISADRWVMDNRGGPQLEKFMSEVSNMSGEKIVERCRMRSLYSDSEKELINEANQWKTCKGGINNNSQIQCLGKWLTLCPALNVEVALVQPLSYFETRKAASLCSDIFKKAEVIFLSKKLNEATNSYKELEAPKNDCVQCESY